jgi:transcriptional regulator with XRE-family HTH domain
MQNTAVNAVAAQVGCGPKESPDLLVRVVYALHARKGGLRKLSKSAGISYDTVLRIRDGKHDPSYGKVKRLAELLAVDGDLATSDRAQGAECPPDQEVDNAALASVAGGDIGEAA